MARVELTPDDASLGGTDSGDPVPVRLSVGDDLVVRLPEPATAGYAWEVAGTGSTLQPLDEVDEPSTGGTVGGTVLRTFRFRPTAPGHDRLSLVLRRPFETGTPPARRLDLALHVTGPNHPDDQTIPPADPH